MLDQAVHGLLYGFTVALAPQNLMWSFFGVLVGNLIGVLPGMGPVSAISILLPLTFALHPVPAILMLAGIFYGSQYGGAIGAILLNLPCHPPHAVTCLDGYPLTQKGKGGTALGIAIVASFFAASFGIIVMIFFSPVLVKIAYDFGPADIFAIMLFGLLSGATMSGRSPLKGIAMTMVGLLCGSVGTDAFTGMFRFTFGFPSLMDGIDLVAIALGLFGVANFLLSVNRMAPPVESTAVRMRDMRPSWAELRQSFLPMLRGTLIGTLFGAMPGTGPTITTFIAYAFERRISRTPGRFGQGALEGVVSPEAASHSKTQVDFIPTMCLGIPGDPIMALILGALMIQGISPGPQLITQHADIFWGLIASFWVGNLLLLVLNVPLIGVWVRLLRVPFRYMFPSALLFIAVGVFSAHNNLFDISEVIAFGIFGAVVTALDFPVAPVLLGFVLGPLVEQNFRRALIFSHGNIATFVERPVSAFFIAAGLLLLFVQLLSSVRRYRRQGTESHTILQL